MLTFNLLCLAFLFFSICLSLQAFHSLDACFGVITLMPTLVSCCDLRQIIQVILEMIFQFLTHSQLTLSLVPMWDDGWGTNSVEICHMFRSWVRTCWQELYPTPVFAAGSIFVDRLVDFFGVFLVTGSLEPQKPLKYFCSVSASSLKAFWSIWRDSTAVFLSRERKFEADPLLFAIGHNRTPMVLR